MGGLAGGGLARIRAGSPAGTIFQPTGGQWSTGHAHHGAQKEEPQRAKVQPPKTCDYFLRSEDFVDVTK